MLLVVLNDQIRPPIKIQNRRNKQTYNTYAFIIDIVSLVLEESCFAEQIFEYKWKTRQKVQLRKRKAELRNGIKGDSPPTRQTWAEHRRGSHPGLARSPPEQGGGQ